MNAQPWRPEETFIATPQLSQLVSIPEMDAHIIESGRIASEPGVTHIWAPSSYRIDI